MPDQYENLQSAILKYKARIEEIELSLACAPLKSSGNWRRNLIEERLHKEQQVAELELEAARLKAQQDSQNFNWESLDHVLVLYFGPALFTALAAQRQASTHTRPDDFVFCKEDGSSQNPDLLRRDVLYPTLDRLGIARTARCAGFHTFRHSAATIINQRTGNLKLVQKMLGHSNLSTTADIYTHTSAEADRSAALALEQAVYGDLFQVVPSFWNRNKSGALN